MTLAERSSALDKKLEDNPIDTSIDTVIKYGQRNRRLIRYVIISLIVDFILTAVLIGIFFRQQHNQDSIANNRSSLIAGCKAGNDFRKDNLALWTYILRIPPTVPQTDEQKQITIDFAKFVNETFMPRDCNAIR